MPPVPFAAGVARETERSCPLLQCRRALVHAMKSNDSLLKLRRFEANEKQHKVTDIEIMIADFKRLAEDLTHQIRVEEENSGIRDVKHFSYPTYAKAAHQRRDNLLASIRDLEAKLAEARAEVAEAMEELKKSELVEERSLIDHDRSASPGRQLGDPPAAPQPHIYDGRP